MENGAVAQANSRSCNSPFGLCRVSIFAGGLNGKFQNGVLACFDIDIGIGMKNACYFVLIDNEDRRYEIDVVLAEHIEIQAKDWRTCLYMVAPLVQGSNSFPIQENGVKTDVDQNLYAILCRDGKGMLCFKEKRDFAIAGS